ncbi:uncharacterized protein UV8b_07916 [Ustilaginoidea virens]|uniref:Helix-turn-helix domain-containing protein n=1 Tax=Ustilaginoidea virens TaxID=1159556 RepID=A0A8E5HXX6_USTVR|nr:uncharacterized protein UV8b_07916 [Ustilaginoidea virens]QUC23675.1 hypothetical protein UV8b_07916 [Ustilaginoidea virens]
MGSLVSKPSQTTAKIGRKFPIREYGDRGPPKLHRVGQEGSNPRSTKCDVISKDGKDSDIISAGFSQRLHKMGVARPNPTISPSSRAPTEVRHTWKGIERKSLPRPTNNWTLTVMETRESLQQLMNKEITSPGQGARRKRRFVDMRTLIDVIKMRNNGVPSEDIEEKFGLQPGITRKIGQVRIPKRSSRNHGIVKYKTPNDRYFSGWGTPTATQRLVDNICLLATASAGFNRRMLLLHLLTPHVFLFYRRITDLARKSGMITLVAKQDDDFNCNSWGLNIVWIQCTVPHARHIT